MSASTFRFACRFCGHFARPHVDHSAGYPAWCCAECGEPAECDSCGGEIPDGHHDGCTEAIS